MNVVFMGTPDFAINCFESVLENHNILAVFTQPDKPKGRGYELTPPPIKVKAVEAGIPVYQPTSLKTGEAFDIIKDLNPDVIVVVAYGRFLPKEILDFPKFGCVNVHASVLPRHRGASPIQWSIVCGDTVTGVSTQKMAVEMDTGEIYKSVTLEIDSDDTADTLHDKLAILGAEVLNSTLLALENGTATTTAQNETDATYAPIIKKEMAKIDFCQSPHEIDCKVRGFNSWPCAYFFLNGKRIKVYKTKSASGNGKPGEVIENSGKLIVACSGGAIEIVELQPEGKRRMTAEEMLRGRPLSVGTVLE